jgi:hypothetical protein
MSYEFEMSLNDSKTKSYLKDGKGNITYAFIDKISMNRASKQLLFEFNVFTVEDEFVIKELKITGDANAVLQFYVSFWTTSLNFNDVSKTEIVSNRLWQDRISYSFNKGKPYIKVQNTTVNSPEEFTVEYVTKRNEFNKTEKIRIAKEELEDKKIKENIKKIKEKRENDENTRISTFEYLVIKKSKKLTFENVSQYFSDENAQKVDLEKKFSEFLTEKEKGTYLIQIKYIVVYGELKKTELTIKKYEN